MVAIRTTIRYRMLCCATIYVLYDSNGLLIKKRVHYVNLHRICHVG